MSYVHIDPTLYRRTMVIKQVTCFCTPLHTPRAASFSANIFVVETLFVQNEWGDKNVWGVCGPDGFWWRHKPENVGILQGKRKNGGWELTIIQSVPQWMAVFDRSSLNMFLLVERLHTAIHCGTFGTVKYYIIAKKHYSRGVAKPQTQNALLLLFPLYLT